MSKWWVGVLTSYCPAFLSIAIAACSAATVQTNKSNLLKCELPKKSQLTCDNLEGTDNGLSDLAMDRKGLLWTISEKTHKVYTFKFENNLISKKPDNIYSVAADDAEYLKGFDLEGITVLNEDASYFAISAEEAKGTRSRVLFANLNGSDLKINHSKTIELSDISLKNLAKLDFNENEGVEGICGYNDTIYIAFETAQDPHGKQRWAPVIKLKGAERKLYKIPLSSKTGKLSALNCDIIDDTAEVLAIERDEGVRRVLSFKIEGDRACRLRKQDLQPFLERESKNCSKRCSPNPEGIVKTKDGRLIIVSDNQNEMRVTISNQIWTFPFRLGADVITQSQTAPPARAAASDCN